MAVEEEASYKGISIQHVTESGKLRQYSPDSIGEAIDDLIQSKLIQANGKWIGGITWKGHDFLDNIRDLSRWSRVKEKARTVAEAPDIAYRLAMEDVLSVV